MPIHFNPDKKRELDSYINVAIHNLNYAIKLTSELQKCRFPNKTIIGRRFNKKTVIYQVEKNLTTSRRDLSVTKAYIQEIVNEYIKANGENILLTSLLNLEKLELFNNKTKGQNRNQNTSFSWCVWWTYEW